MFSFNITAPTTIGAYNFQWQMVKDTNQWFGMPSENRAVVVGTPPTVTAVTPSSGYQKQHDLPIEITGSGFTGATLSVPTDSKIAIADVQVLDPTKITAILYIGSEAPLGNVPLSVTTPTGSVTKNFTINPPNSAGKPVVDSVSSSMILAGSTKTFTVTGSNLSNAEVDGGSDLTITDLIHSGDAQLQFTLTAEASTAEGTYFIVVGIPEFESTGVRVRVLTSTTRPSVEAFTPSTPVAGKAYFFQIEGNNLTGASIESDDPRVHVDLNSLETQAEKKPSDNDSIVGVLVVDPDVPPDTPVTLKVGTGEESDRVQLRIASLDESKRAIENIKPGQPTQLLTQRFAAVKMHKFKPKPKGHKQGRISNFPVPFFPVGGYSCDDGCNTSIPILRGGYLLRVLDCGGILGDQSCFKTLKLGDLKNLRFTYVGILGELEIEVSMYSIRDDQINLHFCTPIICDFGGITGEAIGFWPGKTKTLSYTIKPAFFLPGTAPNCGSSDYDCTDTFTITDLPVDDQLCAEMSGFTISIPLLGLEFTKSGTKCVNTAPALSAKLEASPTSIAAGESTTLSWSIANSARNTIHVSHATISRDIAGIVSTVYDCASACPAEGSTVDFPPATARYSIAVNGTVNGLRDFFSSPVPNVDPNHNANPTVTVLTPYVRITAPDHPNTLSFVATNINGIEQDVSSQGILRLNGANNPIQLSASTNVRDGTITWQVVGDQPSNSGNPLTPNPGANTSFYPTPSHPGYSRGSGRPSPISYLYNVTASVAGIHSDPVTISQLAEYKDIFVQEYINHSVITNLEHGEYRSLEVDKIPSQLGLYPVDCSEHFCDKLNSGDYAFAVDRGMASVAEQVLANYISLIRDLAHDQTLTFGLHVNSGFRNPEHNEIYSTTINSNHQFGRALDLKPDAFPVNFSELDTWGLIVLAAQARPGTSAICENLAGPIPCTGERGLPNHIHISW
ncbi:MAG: hypothetical protein LAO21_14395 [Acidobacteriia bacterium]|nr:hypothetical protein [Terriglobia bacterium]